MTQLEQSDIQALILSAIEEGYDDELKQLVGGLHPADIADLLEGLPPEQRLLVWQNVDISKRGETLVEVAEGVGRDLISDMDTAELSRAVQMLDMDDIADIIPLLPDAVIADLLYTVDKESRQDLDALISYPEDTAGGLMNIDTVTARADITLAVVQRYLRLKASLPEYTDKLFVVDRQNRLTGVLFLSSLLTEDNDKRVADVANHTPVMFKPMTSDSDVADAFQRYNLISAPVVDDNEVLLGRITIDDVVDVIQENADRNVMVRAGLDEEDDIFQPVAESSRKRAVWLGVNLLTAFLASSVISLFEGTIEKMVALAVLMPIVANMGGNAGTQTLTMVIRGLGTKTISSANSNYVLRKEFLVGSVNGLIWALVVALVASLWFGTYELGLIVGFAMIINMMAAAIAGVLLPMLIERLGIDPALAGGVALTTVTDVVGFFAVLGLATLFLV
ncbi:MAG: magnesium transporter MgtE [marine bacterium B5-7]|nr:MAG: magnesium transporter MgtE [marine bacterium B5-7]